MCPLQAGNRAEPMTEAVGKGRSLRLVGVAYAVAVAAAAAWLMWGPTTGRPVYVAVTRPGGGLAWLTHIALVVGLAAVTVELVADVQLHRFVRDRRPGEVLDRGLWSWSRHPNYFGEFSFWLALALFGVAAAPADTWWPSLGALAMLGMFLGASVPMMETGSLQWRPGYQDVVQRVSRFVPRPPRRVAA